MRSGGGSLRRPGLFSVCVWYACGQVVLYRIYKTHCSACFDGLSTGSCEILLSCGRGATLTDSVKALDAGSLSCSYLSSIGKRSARYLSRRCHRCQPDALKRVDGERGDFLSSVVPSCVCHHVELRRELSWER